MSNTTTLWRFKWRWLLIPTLLVFIMYGVLVADNILTGDRAYHDGMDYAGDLKVLSHEFRQYFHGRTEYSAVSLDELHTKGVLSDFSYQTLKKYRHEFHQFSSHTPDNETVLVMHGAWWAPDKFTKRDLTAAEDASRTF